MFETEVIGIASIIANRFCSLVHLPLLGEVRSLIRWLWPRLVQLRVGAEGGSRSRTSFRTTDSKSLGRHANAVCKEFFAIKYFAAFSCSGRHEETFSFRRQPASVRALDQGDSELQIVFPLFHCRR